MEEAFDGLSDHEILTAGGNLLGRLVGLECALRTLIAAHHAPERVEFVWDLLWASVVRAECDSLLPGFDHGLLDQGRRLGGDIAAAALAKRTAS
jgi:hypothetical protein